MADTTNIAAGTILVVVTGQWTKGNLVPIKVIIGGAVYILLLSFMEEGSSDLAMKFAILVFITALFIYAVPIFQKLGLLDGGKRKKKK